MRTTGTPRHDPRWVGAPRVADLTNLLWDRGIPAALHTPSGLRPALVVWVESPDHPLLQWLECVFGGTQVLGMRDHHGEPSPAFWVGVGRAAALAGALVTHASPARPGALLGTATTACWSAFAAVTDALSHGAVATDAADRQQRLAAIVHAALPLADHIVGGLATALAPALRTGPLAAGLVMPSAADAHTWAARLATMAGDGAAVG